MTIPKKYIHDRVILLLLSTLFFLVILQAVIVFINTGQDGGLNLVQYRPKLGLSAYTYDSSSITYYSFVVFAVMVAVVHSWLSIKVFLIRRQYSLLVLSTGVLLLVLSVIVSNALLIRG